MTPHAPRTDAASGSSSDVASDAEAELDETCEGEALRMAKPAAQRGVVRRAALNRVLALALGRESGPQRVGRFEVHEKIGEGGMGVVYRASDPQLEREVALKFLHGADSEEERRRILREARNLARLSDAHVVTIYEVGVVDERVYFAMQYLPQGSLHTWLKSHPKTGPKELLSLFIDAGKGLAAAHAKGLVHRDFKPPNVFIDDEGRALVGDFGVATAGRAAVPAPLVRPELQALNAVEGRCSPPASDPDLSTVGGESEGATRRVGTPAFMSPEQLAGKRCDARSDQFSFCLSLRRCLEQLDSSRAALSKEEERRLEAAIERGLAAHAADRFASMEPLLAELEAVLEPPGPPVLVRRARWVASLVAAGALAAGLGWWLSDSGSAQKPYQACASEANALVETLNTQRSTIEAQFAKTGRGTTYLAIAPTLGVYAQAWQEAKGAACADTWSTGEQSNAVLDLRVACLSSRRSYFETVLAAFAEADEELVNDSPSVVSSLPSLEACADVEQLARTR